MASDWVTLLNDGGYADQPEYWLRDVGYFNAVHNFYMLIQEKGRLEQAIRDNPEG